LKSARPEAVGQDRRARRSRPVVARVEQTTPFRAQSHHFKVRPADDAGANHARLAEPDHRELDGREVAERRQGFNLALQVAQLRNRELHVVDPNAGCALAQVNQSILVAIDQRAQQNALNHAKNRRIGADAQCQRDDDGDGQPFHAAERTNGEAEVGEEAHTLTSKLTTPDRHDRAQNLPDERRARKNAEKKSSAGPVRSAFPIAGL
jgi:hypothetical protein